MADTTDVLLKFCEQQWIEAKQAEDQRATITNIILLISSAVVGVMAQRGLSISLLPLSILLIILGVYGVIMTGKLYERHQFHMARLRHWRIKIDELNPGAQLEMLRKGARADHEKAFPRTVNFRLNYLWGSLHLLIASAGVILTLLCVTR